MQIVIDANYSKCNYIWRIWDGPDGIDKGGGECDSLDECFEQILEWRRINTLQYL